MRVGVDVFTIRELGLDPYQTLDYLAERGFEGAQFCGIRSLSEKLDAGELSSIRQYADSKNLYSHVSLTAVNPVIYQGTFDELVRCIEEEIIAAAAGNWHELHSVINAGMERYESLVPWSVHVDQCIKLINRLRPTLEKYGSRINLEDHGEATFDVLKVIECTGTHLTGVCLDMANTFVNAEDPVLAARRVAPYTHLTHTKDAIICFNDEGILRQGKPPGSGDVPFEKVLPILAEYDANLPLSIEDHKWLFTARIFDKDWMARNPELTPYELGQVVKTAWATQQKIFAGTMPSVEDYEKTPYMDEMEQRLALGRDYLNGLIRRLGLYTGDKK